MNTDSVSRDYLKFVFIFRQIMMRWREKFTEQIRLKVFLQKLKEWQSGGFITSDVWFDIGNLVDSDSVASALSAVTQHDKSYEKKYSDEFSDDRLLSCVARYIVDSRVLHFTIDVLGLRAGSYQVEEKRKPDDKHLIKFKVGYTK